MPKKIVVLLGSGRRGGNTEQLADAFIRGAEEAGHPVKKISLVEKRVDGCLGCNACRFGKPCIQKDDWNEIAPDLLDCDMIVFASPLFFWTVTARIKAVIERLYSLAQPDPDPPKGRYEKNLQKDAVLLMTAADDLCWTFSQAESYYRFAVINYIGMRDKGMLLCGGCGGSMKAPGIKNTPYLEQAFEMGKTVYSNED